MDIDGANDPAFDGMNEFLADQIDGGVTWDDLMVLMLLGSAICASNAGLSPDDYMGVVRSVRVTDDGVFGDA
jgi:hypothetical protein